MSMVDSYSYFRSGLELALLQKTEVEIRKILKKPSDEFLISKPYENYGPYSDILAFEYVSMLMHLIDSDLHLDDGIAKFYREIMEKDSEIEEEGNLIYVYSLGLLINGIRKYGEEPFKSLSKEADQLMRSLPLLNTLNMSEYLSSVMEPRDLRNKYYWELRSFEIEMKYMYFYYWDLYYCDPHEIIYLIKELPIFAKKYIALYKKIINIIQSLGGVNPHDYGGDGEKTTI